MNIIVRMHDIIRSPSDILPVYDSVTDGRTDGRTERFQLRGNTEMNPMQT